ncbi:MAG TPA: hypothetical protein VFS44_01880 [Gemmatimonadaceae bacterium]|nr:hypothetical protein [Gemmatimonadaceae bacterium]
MRRATIVTRWIVRLTGIVQILLGVLFWTGHARTLIPVHMLVGSIVVLGLWVLTGLTARARRGAGLTGLAIVLGLALPIVGVVQARVLPGAMHWVIQVVHLLLGLGVLRLAEVLAEPVVARGRGATLADAA